MLLNALVLDTGLWSARIIIQGRQPSRYTRKTGEINLTFAQTHVKTQMCILAHWSLVIMMTRLKFLEIYVKLISKPLVPYRLLDGWYSTFVKMSSTAWNTSYTQQP